MASATYVATEQFVTPQVTDFVSPLVRTSGTKKRGGGVELRDDRYLNSSYGSFALI